jgi:hypothetical protein
MSPLYATLSIESITDIEIFKEFCEYLRTFEKIDRTEEGSPPDTKTK